MNQIMQEVQSIEEKALRQLCQHYGDPRAPRAVFAATAALTKALDTTLEAKAGEHGIHLACGKGCYYCCHIRVEAFAPEIFRIKDHLERTLPADQLSEIRKGISANARRAAGLLPQAYNIARIACAFLTNGVCSIHDVRPSMCRTHHSTDVEACKKLHNEPEAPEHGAQAVPGLLMYAASHLRALHRALKESGLDDRTYELHQALDTAFSLPGAYDRWAAGEEIFKSLPETSGEQS